MPRHTLTTVGGTQTGSILSGAVAPTTTGTVGAFATGSDVMFFSGNGRLDGGFLHQQVNSGVAVVFYDGAAPVSGGPISASGHKVIGVLLGGGPQVSGFASQFPGAGLVQFGVPFTSGLCVNSRSGQPGFTITFTPEQPIT